MWPDEWLEKIDLGYNLIREDDWGGLEWRRADNVSTRIAAEPADFRGSFLWWSFDAWVRIFLDAGSTCDNYLSRDSRRSQYEF